MFFTRVLDDLFCMITGASFGGLLLGRLLHRFGIECTVLEQRASLTLSRDRGIGIWNQAQSILALPELGIFAEFQSQIRQIRPAAYRNRKGEWLSMSSNSAENRARVATISESVLLQMLASSPISPPSSLSSSPSPSHDSIPTCPPWLRLNHHVQSIRAIDDGTFDSIVVTCQNGQQFRTKLLIGADGAQSGVRKFAFPQQKHEIINAPYYSWGAVLPHVPFSHSATLSSNTSDLHHNNDSFGHHNIRPNDILRQPTDTSGGQVDEFQAWETLSRGCRFACVPLKRGLFWFASIPRDIAPPLDMNPADVKYFLMSKFAHCSTSNSTAGFHAPISQLIAATPSESLDARAIWTSSTWSSLFNQCKHGSREPSSDWFTSISSPLSSSSSSSHVCLIGDAAHPTASNLAQGAAIAIEDAYHLAAHLIPLLRPSSTSSSLQPSSHHINRALSLFSKQRQPRINAHRITTQFTEAPFHDSLLSLPRSELAEAIRDWPLLMTKRLFSSTSSSSSSSSLLTPAVLSRLSLAPDFNLNSSVFDACLLYSLGYELDTSQRHPPSSLIPQAAEFGEWKLPALPTLPPL